MEAADFLAEEGGVDSGGRSVARETPATSAGALDTGPWTARDEVMQSDAKQSFTCKRSSCDHTEDSFSCRMCVELCFSQHTINTFGLCFTAPPPPSVPEDPPAEDDSFELPTLEEVARATGTLQPQPLSTPVQSSVRSEHAGFSLSLEVSRTLADYFTSRSVSTTTPVLSDANI